MKTPLIIAILLSLSACAADAPRAPAKPSRIIDTHIHLYDPTRPQGVPWPSPDSKTLYKPVLPKDFKAVANPHGVTMTVIVEASAWPEDNQWLIDQTKDDKKTFVGIVGNLRPGTPEFDGQLARYAADKRFVGIRPPAPSSTKEQPVADEKYLADIGKLAARGLALDANPINLEQVAAIAAKHPNLRIVINHVNNYRIRGEAPDSKWIEKLRAAAASRNVYMKVSALGNISGKNPAPTDIAYYKPVLDAVYDIFGEDRLIWGSNWPVSDLNCDYGTELGLAIAYFQPKGKDVMEKVFWKNAVKAYGLKVE